MVILEDSQNGTTLVSQSSGPLAIFDLITMQSWQSNAATFAGDLCFGSCINVPSGWPDMYDSCNDAGCAHWTAAQQGSATSSTSYNSSTWLQMMPLRAGRPRPSFTRSRSLSVTAELPTPQPPSTAVPSTLEPSTAAPPTSAPPPPPDTTVQPPPVTSAPLPPDTTTVAATSGTVPTATPPPTTAAAPAYAAARSNVGSRDTATGAASVVAARTTNLSHRDRGQH